MLAAFDACDVPTDGAVIRTLACPGEGTPVVLLHGYPQTHAMWHAVAPRLAATRRPIVLMDLRGYGASRCLDGDLTFRAMARDVAQVLDSLGHDRAHVVGHDRGARVTHRLALDHPERVSSVALLDILPTLDVWEQMDAWLGLRYHHWLFLAQPDLPARMIGHDPVGYLHAALGGLSAPGSGDSGLDAFAPEALAAYEEAARTPGVVEAWCGDYRAAAGPDREHDEADRGRTLDHPTLVLWGSRGVVGAQVDPLATWRAWFPRAQGHALDAGHFLAEALPAETAAAVIGHLDAV